MARDGILDGMYAGRWFTVKKKWMMAMTGRTMVHDTEHPDIDGQNRSTTGWTMVHDTEWAATDTTGRTMVHDPDRMRAFGRWSTTCNDE
jgi:hypothetical protein